MQKIPEPTPEIRNFVKTILAAKADPTYHIGVGWFMAGAWYMDAISMLVLTLPDDDPMLAQILDSMRSGTLYENEVIAKNILRFGMAMDDSAVFVANSKAESLLLHARALVQNSARRPSAKPPIAKSAWESLANRWRAALSSPLWWLGWLVIGTLALL
jgi:hypothetical protein